MLCQSLKKALRHLFGLGNDKFSSSSAIHRLACVAIWLAEWIAQFATFAANAAVPCWPRSLHPSPATELSPPDGGLRSRKRVPLCTLLVARPPTGNVDVPVSPPNGQVKNAKARLSYLLWKSSTCGWKDFAMSFSQLEALNAIRICSAMCCCKQELSWSHTWAPWAGEAPNSWTRTQPVLLLCSSRSCLIPTSATFQRIRTNCKRCSLGWLGGVGAGPPAQGTQPLQPWQKPRTGKQKFTDEPKLRRHTCFLRHRWWRARCALGTRT